MLTRFPYPEYHTSKDTPEIIDYDKIERTGQVILKAIEIYEKDYIPVKNFKGPLMRSKYGIQTGNAQMNLAWDYLLYNLDGKKTLAELCVGYGLDFDLVYEVFNKLGNEIIRITIGEGEIKEVAKEERVGLSRKGHVSHKPGKRSKALR
jgi:aminopeptidase-like protein